MSVDQLGLLPRVGEDKSIALLIFGDGCFEHQACMDIVDFGNSLDQPGR